MQRKIAIIGTGYVGLTAGVCLASLGHNITCVDKNQQKVKALSQGNIPIFEPGLGDVLKQHQKNIAFTTDLNRAVQQAEVIFVCVGTPSNQSGAVDMSQFQTAIKQVAQAMNGQTHGSAPTSADEHDSAGRGAPACAPAYKVLVNKSTVPVGTADWVKKEVKKHFQGKFDVVSNPEFMREGSAVRDFLEPDRIIIGVDSQKAEKIIRDIFSSIQAPKIVVDPRSSELIKYSANAFLATKISFINEIANICQKAKADVEKVAQGIGADKRIGPKFLRAGIGWGGSCLAGKEFVFVGNPTPQLTSFKKAFDFFSKKKEFSNGLNMTGVSFNSNKAEISPIGHLSKRKYNGKMIEIKTWMGRTIETTADHPMAVLKNNNIEVKLAKKLKKGDELPLPVSFPKKEKERIDLIKELKGDEFGTKIKVRPISGTIGDYKQVIAPYLKQFKKLTPCQKYDFFRHNCIWLNIYQKIAKNIPLKRENMLLFTAGGATTYVPAIINLDEDFCRLLGYYLAEGNIHYEKGKHNSIRARIKFSFHEKEKEYIDDVCSILTKLHIKHKVYHRPKNSTRIIVASSRVFAFVLDDILKCGTDSYTANIPKFLFFASKKKKRALLKGLFRGDGSVYFHNHCSAITVEFGTASPRLIQATIILLQSLGIIASYKKAFQNKSTVPAHFARISCYKQVKKMIFFDKKTNKKMKQRLSLYKRIISPIGFTRYKDFVGVKIKEIKEKIVEKKPVFSLEFARPPHLFISSLGLLVHNCFPKDIRALMAIAEHKGYDFKLLKAVMQVNEEQKQKFAAQIKRILQQTTGNTVAVWGLAFKPHTDDVRKSPAVDIIKNLLKAGCKIKAYDPIATENAKKALPKNKIQFCNSALTAAENADALALVTAWPEFSELDMQKVKQAMNNPAIVDGRNLFNPEQIRALGFTYHSIGR